MLKMICSFQLLDVIVGRSHCLILANGDADFDSTKKSPVSSSRAFDPECFRSIPPLLPSCLVCSMSTIMGTPSMEVSITE